MKRIVLFASGSGSNVENIVNYFRDGQNLVTVSAVLVNKRDAKVLDRCNRLKINGLYFNETAFYQTDCVLKILDSLDPDLIVLAGFLRKIPENIIQKFSGKIINIHPALLPKYGGKGMYGNHVHRAVKEDRETETGITIHHVTKNYDEGAVIFQASTGVSPNDSVEDIAKKVHELEYAHFPRIIEKLLWPSGVAEKELRTPLSEG